VYCQSERTGAASGLNADPPSQRPQEVSHRKHQKLGMILDPQSPEFGRLRQSIKPSFQKPLNTVRFHISLLEVAEVLQQKY
jgi:hypothetical protein